ncbi:MAG: amino acid adenylation domain-containing protein [Moorea sp. SIO2I5]|nr:amino acid adenylation domain-containing protein [Moorena sp. SIO2I5]
MQDVSIEGFRLSPQQKRLWQMQQVNSCQSYCAYCSILIEGDCQPQILQAALQKIISIHEILHTNFPTLQGMTTPLQVINDSVTAPITDYELRGLSPEEQATKLQLIVHEKSQQTFDFEQGSLLDISLVALAPDKHILFICLPALCADQATLESLVREISHYYAVCLHNKEVADEPQPLQYVDIAEWQNELFEGEEGELGREYWQKRSEFIDFVNYQLNFEKPVTLKLEFKPELFSLVLREDQVTQLEALAQNHNTSISILIEACWQILLWRITGQPDITIGTYCDGRNYEELESSLGLLAKHLPIYCHLEYQYKFSEILKQTSEAKDEAFKWQESFSWEQIAESNGHTSGSSFFPVCFEFEEQPAKYSAADVSFSLDKHYVCFDQFKVKLSCIRKSNALVAEFHYDSNLFQLEDIERLAGQFKTLLESVINQPEATISELNILSGRDRQQLLVEFNQTKTNYSQDKCIHQLFEQQTARTPSNIAVVYEDQQLTYTQLNTRANQLAHYLQTLGVGSETIVALCVERSLEMLIGMLGILKTGAAYLPLDPLLPNERLALMLEDAGASVILTQQHLTERVYQQTASVVCLDTNWQAIAQGAAPEAIAQHSVDNPLSEVTPENLVYVIYTSGSTGKPKGVAVEHRQLCNYVYALLDKLQLPEGSSLATVSTFAADLGNTAIFTSLCSGGCLHVISQERATNPEALVDYFERHPIDCLKIVPSHFNALLSASQPEKILPRERLILGGEALSWNLVEKIQHYKPSCQIINHYGPTEATVGVLTYPIKGESIRNSSETVPLGRPIANTQIYILDNHLQPVPMGVLGQLYIGGDSLARGYLNQPELTTERFIHNPFSDQLESRLYKTGDLARYLPDGNIEFMGRIDHQVKVRGFRIELGEIESVVRQYPALRETAVLAREDEPGRKRIVGYVVPNQQSEFSVAELRNFLKERLPEYMLPSAVVQLKSLPLTPNGKIDRQALPAPESVRPELEGKFVAPRTPIEETIAGIWTQVLGREQVGIYDDFFELGGDSILSIQIIARVNQAGLQLTPKQLFDYPTVAGLAAVAGTASTIQAEQGIVTGFLPLTPIQHWFFEQQLCDAHHWNQAILLEVPPAIVPTLLEQAVQKLLEHHDALRLKFIPEESGWQQINQGLEDKKAVPFSCQDLSELPVAEQETILEATAGKLQASLDLTNGSLMQVALFKLGDNQPNRLLWVLHHLVVDGISWRILLEDLQQIYQQLSQGQTVSLPPKTSSFKQWSEFLQEYAQSAELQQERDYWLKASCKSVSHLPMDHSGDANTVSLARNISVSLSLEETTALLQEVPAVYKTEINDVLLTALVQTFAQWTGEDYLLLALEGHGREAIANDIDLSRTVGWFTTIFPLLLTLEGISQPGEALKAIKEQLRGIPNRGIGYGVLRYLSKDQELSRQLQTLPQADVRFNYLGQFNQNLAELSMFKPLKQTLGESRSPRGNRRYLLDINGLVLGGQLQLDWTYSEQIHHQATIEQLAQGYVEKLRSLIAHCQSPEVGGYTPSDFSEANVSQQELDMFLSKINRRS